MTLHKFSFCLLFFAGLTEVNSKELRVVHTKKCSANEYYWVQGLIKLELILRSAIFQRWCHFRVYATPPSSIHVGSMRACSLHLHNSACKTWAEFFTPLRTISRLHYCPTRKWNLQERCSSAWLLHIVIDCKVSEWWNQQSQTNDQAADDDFIVSLNPRIFFDCAISSLSLSGGFSGNKW